MANARERSASTRSAVRWNIAADAEINDDLLRDGVTLPPRPVSPKLLGLPSDRAAEFYYHRLVARPNLHVACGSGCTGVADGRLTDELSDVPGITDLEAALLRRQVADAILAHRATGSRGNGPGGWQRWAEAYLRPQLDWRKLLAAQVRRGLAADAGRTDYSFGRPSRRAPTNVVLPTLRRPSPAVAIVIDTSASVDAAALSRAWTEVHGCLRALGVRRDLLTVFAADTTATRVKVGMARRVALTGGGGTDLRVGVSAAMDLRPRPRLVVVLTDGMTPWPDRPLHDATLLVVVIGPFSPWPPPSWATTIQIPNDDAPATDLHAARQG